MPDKPVNILHKEHANNIVGTWYNRIPDEVITFSFLEDLSKEAEMLTLINGKSTKATYNIIDTLNSQWYLQVWSKEGKKNGVNRIEILTASVLTVSSVENKVATYQRKVDYTFANRLLDNFAK